MSYRRPQRNGTHAHAGTARSRRRTSGSTAGGNPRSAADTDAAAAAAADSAAGAEPPVEPGVVGHPKGTLAIVTFYAVLFAFGWLMIYLLLFVPRGTPHP